MQLRTDLALECREISGKDIDGVEFEEEQIEGVKITRMKITNASAEEEIGKPQGTYITVEVPPFTDDYDEPVKRAKIVAKEIINMLPKKGLVLVAGLGNSNITPDNLGPMTASDVIATRHIQGELAKSIGLENLRPVAVLVPGVLGQTGVETAEILIGVTNKIKPSAIIIVDALASRRLERLGCTVQISDSGISPGSGVQNARPRINKNTMGVPVISLGVPTVVDAITLVTDLIGDSREDVEKKAAPRGEHMMITPREIDLLIKRSAKLSAMSINCALQPDFDIEELVSLMS